MLVQVEYQTVQKWVRVPMTDDCYEYLKFMQEGKLSTNYVVVASAIKLSEFKVVSLSLSLFN